jgi:putative membrane protein
MVRHEAGRPATDGGIMPNLHPRLTRPAGLLLALCIVTLALSSCAKRTDETTTTTTTTTPETTATATVPSDAEIAATVTAANDTDIETAKLALEKSANADVKQFANEMIAAHTQLNQQGSALLTKLGVTPADNPTSTSIKTGGESTRATLKGLSGADFDKAYVNAEVDLHQAVLDQLDNSLIPSAQNAELKTLLEQARPTISAHLDHAKSLKSKLGA